MKAENIPEFAAYLETLGFISTEEAEGLLGLPLFDANAILSRNQFGTDTMLLRMDIDRDISDGSLATSGYQATLLRLTFAHGVYDGIDTPDLEKRLIAHNWSAASEDKLTDRAMSSAMTDLITLGQSSDPAARTTAGMLMLRHWSDTELEKFANGLVDRQEHERKGFFPMESAVNDINILEAYNLLCGRAILRSVYDETQATEVMHLTTMENGAFKEWPFFDLARVLKNLPLVTKLDDNTGPTMIAHLALGERVPVEVISRGARISATVEIDAPNATIAVFRRNGVKLDTAELLREGESRQARHNQGDKNRQGPSL